MKTPNGKFQVPRDLPDPSSKLAGQKMAPGLGILLGVWILGFGASAADDPADELASFQIADGFEINLFASETNGVVKPIQVRFDPRGRLWVIGSTVYPQIEPGQKPNDKVLVLEDTDGDGRADRTTVFADGLMIPTGIELVENGCYVGHGTELLQVFKAVLAFIRAVAQDL